MKNGRKKKIGERKVKLINFRRRGKGEHKGGSPYILYVDGDGVKES